MFKNFKTVDVIYIIYRNKLVLYHYYIWSTKKTWNILLKIVLLWVFMAKEKFISGYNNGVLTKLKFSNLWFMFESLAFIEGFTLLR